MSIFRALNTLAQLEGGVYTSSTLDTLLADPASYSEWQLLCSMEKQFSRMMQSDVVDVVLGSKLAWNALASARNPLVYQPEILLSWAPSAWGAYLPHDSYMTAGTDGNLLTWANALKPGTRDFTAASSTNRPAVSRVGSPLSNQPIPTFDGTNDLMLCSEVFNQPTAYTIFVVYNRNTSVQSFALVGARQGDTLAQGFYVNGNAVSYIANTAVTSFTATTPVPANTWGFSRFRRESANVLYHSKNGEAESAPATLLQAIPSFTIDPLRLGSVWSLFARGGISEVWLLAGNGDANSPEVQRITSMLKSKYNV